MTVIFTRPAMNIEIKGANMVHLLVSVNAPDIPDGVNPFLEPG